jgi:ATP-dependent helicase/nuclease subunit A
MRPSAERTTLATNSVDVDDAARAFAVDPRNNVVLEASAGTGKTTVLVHRYVNLLKAGVEPAHILAITFTRKAATEMRERIIRELRNAAALSQMDRTRWLELRDRLGEISISTIDAFCLSLLREFPLEADLDPGFDMADETEVPRFVEEALDRSMRIFTRIAHEDPDVALVIAQLGVSRTRAGLAALLERRLVAWTALHRFLDRGPRDLHPHDVCTRARHDVLSVFQHLPGGLQSYLDDGPVRHPRYQLFRRQVERLQAGSPITNAETRAMLDRIALHFLTQDGEPRKRGGIHPYNVSHYPSENASKRHRDATFGAAPAVEQIFKRFARDLNAVLARGIKRMFAIALEQYRQTLDARSALDFSDVLERALDLLRRMDEFSQSRFRLESRYHHVLVDEFQDTSRAQWELVSLLVQSWGEGMGLASNPSIFIVGDRKQSIYRFRDAEVAVLHEAGRYIEALRPGGAARRSIARSFRSVPELLEFVNEVCGEMANGPARSDSFTYGESDRFPSVVQAAPFRGPALGISAAETPEDCAVAVAAEIERILSEDTVRDKKTGVARAARPGDIAILFRSRTSHREFERELERREIPAYVYKGLGFFDSDEIKDACALLRYLAQPESNLRAAAFVRSGIARLSDGGLAALAPNVAAAVLDGPPAGVRLSDEDSRLLDHLRRHVPTWLSLVDRIPPADLFEAILPDVAYAYELRGPRDQQAWENLKKMRGLVRRIQNRGYATLARIADHVDALSAGDESNAVLEAVDAVNLMTVHASKGLEFPVVFIVNIARGATGFPRPVRVIVDSDDAEPSVSVAPFVSETDALERVREQHESRRLLYVAMTRARDRLYLSSAVKDGILAPGRGSLAEVLPASLKPLFTEAAKTSEPTLAWTAGSGRVFEWRVCQPVPRPPRAQTLFGDTAETAQRFGRMSRDSVTPRVSVSDWFADGHQSYPARYGPSDRLVGILVHRLLQATGAGLLVDSDAVSLVTSLVTLEERALTPDLDRVLETAVGTYSRLLRVPLVAEVLASGGLHAEVPFSLQTDGPNGPVILRGIIDGLAIMPDNRVIVLEFKTGARHAAHEEQLALYLRAATELFPGRVVEGRLIYDE